MKHHNISSCLIGIVALVNCTFSAFIYAANINMNLSSKVEIAQGLTSKNSGNEKAKFTLEPEFEIDINEDSKLTVIFNVSAEFNEGLQANTLDRNSYMQINKPLLIGDETAIELREFYYETNIGDNYLTLGKQQIVWGKTDGLKILDVINPQSFNEFILPDFEDSRIPQWLLNVEIPVSDNSDLQILWVFDTTSHILPNSEGKFAITSPRLVPQIPDGVNVNILPSSALPAFKNSDIGFRWSAFISGWDLTLNYLYHHNDLPVLFQNLSFEGELINVNVQPEFKRSQLIGGSFSNTFGDFTFRGELGYSTDHYFIADANHNNNGVHKSDELSYALGVDWYGFSDTLISFQFFQSHLIDKNETVIRPNIDTTLTLLMQTYFFNDTLKAEMLILNNIEEHDGLIRPKISYDLTDNVKLSLGLDIFHGNKKGLFGQFKDKDRIMFTAQYDF